MPDPMKPEYGCVRPAEYVKTTGKRPTSRRLALRLRGLSVY